MHSLAVTLHPAEKIALKLKANWCISHGHSVTMWRTHFCVPRRHFGETSPQASDKAGFVMRRFPPQSG